MQQNCDWAALENPQIDTFDLNIENTTMITSNSKYISMLVWPRLTKNTCKRDLVAL